ncbi:MAG: DUF2059 domain-containing protein [Kiritimatiellaceae bacterium]|nr:DUF2059 domain-containing protein [Kiritimatiellaceae bacterium]
MRQITRTIMIVISAVTLCMSTYAETSDAKRADIKRLMEVTGSGELATQMLNQMIPAFKQIYPMIPDEFWNEFVAELNMDELIELCIPSYDKCFTHDEIKELLKFYETPIGKKMIQVQPQIMQECMMAGQMWGKQIGAKAALKIENYKKD